MLDIKDYIFPITKVRVGLWLLYALIIYVFASLGLFGHAQDFILSNIDAAMILIFSAEPLYMLTMLALSQYKEPVPSQAPDPLLEDPEIGAGELPCPVPPIPRFTEDPRYKNREVAVIITCHNSEENIRETVASFLKHVFPNQIFIADNGSKPSDKTESI